MSLIIWSISRLQREIFCSLHSVGDWEPELREHGTIRLENWPFYGLSINNLAVTEINDCGVFPIKQHPNWPSRLMHWMIRDFSSMIMSRQDQWLQYCPNFHLRGIYTQKKLKSSHVLLSQACTFSYSIYWNKHCYTCLLPQKASIVIDNTLWNSKLQRIFRLQSIFI